MKAKKFIASPSKAPVIERHPIEKQEVEALRALISQYGRRLPRFFEELENSDKPEEQPAFVSDGYALMKCL